MKVTVNGQDYDVPDAVGEELERLRGIPDVLQRELAPYGHVPMWLCFLGVHWSQQLRAWIDDPKHEWQTFRDDGHREFLREMGGELIDERNEYREFLLAIVEGRLKVSCGVSSVAAAKLKKWDHAGQFKIPSADVAREG